MVGPIEVLKGALLAAETVEKGYKIRQALSFKKIEVMPFFVVCISYYELIEIEQAQSHLTEAIKKFKNSYDQLKYQDMTFPYKMQWHDEWDIPSIEEEYPDELELENEDDVPPSFFVSGLNMYIYPVSSMKLFEVIRKAVGLTKAIETELRQLPNVKIHQVSTLSCLKGHEAELEKLYHNLTKRIRDSGIEVYHKFSKVPDGSGMITLSLSNSEVTGILLAVI